MPNITLAGLDNDAIIALVFLVSILGITGGLFLWVTAKIMAKPRARG